MKKYMALLIVFAFSLPAFSNNDVNYNVFAQKCSSCHGLEIIEKQKKTKNQWKDTIKRMEKYGANFEGKQGQILEYLANKDKK
jgi:hypothetical protein